MDSSASEGLLEGYKPATLTSRLQNKSRRSQLWFSYAYWLFFSIFALGGVLLFSYLVIHSLNKRPSCSCGATVAEAKSLGCKFDTVEAAWLPPACRDDENSAEFDRAGPGTDGSWTYYTDRNKTGTYNISELGDLARVGEFYTTLEWHIAHCVYVWRKQARAEKLGITLEKRYEGDHHIIHCHNVFESRGPLDAILTKTGAALNADFVPWSSK